MFTEEPVKQYEYLGLRYLGIYLPSNAAGLNWKEAYADPEYRWSTTTLPIKQQDRYAFENGATMFGRTHIKDQETGQYLNLNVLDIDCEKVRNRLSVPIEQILSDSSWDWVTDKLRELVKAFLDSSGVVNGDYSQSLLDIFQKSTFVTKTRKVCGYHVYWLSKDQKQPIGSNYCLNGSEFEIKTNDRLGLCTLPGSGHKEDLGFRYQAIGRTDLILASDILYDLFLEMFKDCIINGKLEDNNTNNNTNTNSLPVDLGNITTLLMIVNSVVIPIHHRHNTLISIADSILFKHSGTKSNDELKKFFIQVNQQCCKPEPQPDSDIEQIWKDATEYVSNSKESESEKEHKEKDKQRVTPNDIEFVINTIKKEAPYDETSIKQLFYGMSSAFTKLPIHDNVNSRKTGSGKTYDLVLTVDYFPNRYVILLAGVSDKGFIHEEGTQVLVDEETGTTTPLEVFTDPLHIEIENLEGQLFDLGSKQKAEKKQLKKRIKEFESELKELYRQSQKLIILENRIVIVLDTAQEGLYNALMSIISQDTPRDQVYQFTDKNGSGKLGATKNRFRGTPCMFTTQVIDDTRQTRFQEKNRRFIHVTPNTSREKIHSATHLIGQKYGLLPQEYDNSVVSRKDKEHAREIVSTIVDKLIDHTKGLGPKESGIKIPFYESIVHCLNPQTGSTNEWAMTVMDRMMRYLTIITKVYMDSRPRIIDTETGVFYPISTFDDLKETLQLMVMASSAIRSYIATWYNNVFLPAYNKLGGVPQADKDSLGNILVQENEVGLTTKDLAEATKEYLHIPKPSREDVLKEYIYPLLNQGIIDKSKSVINNKEIILSPAEEGEIFSMFAVTDSDGKLRLEVNDRRFFPYKNVIEDSYVILSKWFSKEGGTKNKNRYLLLDHDGNEISTKELADRYFYNPEECFKLGNNSNETQIRLLQLTEGAVSVRDSYHPYEHTKKYFLYHPVWRTIFTEFSNNIIEESSIPQGIYKASFDGKTYACRYCGLEGHGKDFFKGHDCSS